MLLDTSHLFGIRYILRPLEVKEGQSEDINGTLGSTTHNDILQISFLSFLPPTHQSPCELARSCSVSKSLYFISPKLIKENYFKPREGLLSYFQVTETYTKRVSAGEELICFWAQKFSYPIQSSRVQHGISQVTRFKLLLWLTHSVLSQAVLARKTPPQLINFYIVFSTTQGTPSIKATPCGLKFGKQIIPFWHQHVKSHINLFRESKLQNHSKVEKFLHLHTPSSSILF